MDALLDFLTINRQAEWRAAVKKQITRHEIEQRHSYAGYFGADYVLAEREHGKPGRFGQQVSVDHNMVQSCVYQYHSHNERKAQEADGSLSGRMENSCPRVFFIR